MGEQQRLIDIRHVSKSFDGVTVLSDFSLYIREKEFITLLGPSGRFISSSAPGSSTATFSWA